MSTWRCKAVTFKEEAYSIATNGKYVMIRPSSRSVFFFMNHYLFDNHSLFACTSKRGQEIARLSQKAVNDRRFSLVCIGS